jgi:hypothetical protein
MRKGETVKPTEHNYIIQHFKTNWNLLLALHKFKQGKFTLAHIQLKKHAFFHTTQKTIANMKSYL